MWKNYIKVTIRNLSRNRAFNLINISGLAIGLASSVFIILIYRASAEFRPVS
jgi:putative ABC transport system permease protein